jgi:hypothetical protein
MLFDAPTAKYWPEVIARFYSFEAKVVFAVGLSATPLSDT